MTRRATRWALSRPAIGALWQGYRSAAGLDDPGNEPEADALLRRAVAFSAARLFMAAHELSLEQEEIPAQAVLLLQLGVEYSGRSRLGPVTALRHSPGVRMAMTDLHPDLITITDAVQILSATSYRVLDQTRDLGDKTGDVPGDLPPLVSALAGDLYDRLYIRPSGPGGPRGSDWLVHRDFLAALSAANGGRGTWDPDWTVRQIASDGQVVVGRHELRTSGRPRRTCAPRPDGSPRENAAASVSPKRCAS